MRLLNQLIHHELLHLNGSAFERRTARGIVLRGQDILLIYTKRYNDYSFPGGGIEPHEDWIAGLKRELQEEIGAISIQNIQPFGSIEEYRPHYKPEYDLIHMWSYFYTCSVEEDLNSCQPEDYEIANGSKPVWVNIYEAIQHNQQVMANQEASMGFSIQRETMVLELVEKELLNDNQL